MSDAYLEYFKAAVVAVAILLCGYVGIRILLRIVRKSLRRTKLDEAHHAFIISLFRVVLWLIVLATVLGSLGLPASTFLAVLGTVGAVIALALRDSLSNFAGGMQILFSKPFHKGDVIETLEVSGQIEEINLLYTTLKAFDHRVITIPNGKLSNGIAINHTRERKRRIDLVFPIRYGEDTEQVRVLLLAIAESDARVFADPPIFLGVGVQKDSIVPIELQVWCETPDYWDLKYRLQELAEAAFREAGIHMSLSCERRAE